MKNLFNLTIVASLWLLIGASVPGWSQAYAPAELLKVYEINSTGNAVGTILNATGASNSNAISLAGVVVRSTTTSASVAIVDATDATGALTASVLFPPVYVPAANDSKAVILGPGQYVKSTYGVYCTVSGASAYLMIRNVGWTYDY